MSTEIQNINKNMIEKMGVNEDAYLVLKKTIFPGAKDESIALAISYCKSFNLDIMQKPVHLVPMSVKDSNGKYEYRDVVMPGITLYRIQASRTGDCLGISDPEFGPMVRANISGLEISYPEWCRITVKRLVKGHIAEFSAKEYWLENVALNKYKQPNDIWIKRARGQLAKCAESQAWRKAFPELFGGIYTAEEMEGREMYGPSNVINHPKINEAYTKKRIGQKEIDELVEKIDLSGVPESDVCLYYKVDNIRELNFGKWENACRKLDKTIQSRGVESVEESIEVEVEPSSDESMEDAINREFGN